MKPLKNKWLELAIVLVAPLLSVIDVFIINVAIPAIKKGVHGTDAEVQLVIAGYLLGYAAFLITGGRAGDHFGRKKVFFWGMLFFTLFSCLCGLSQNGFQLIATRFLQGLSASFMVPQAIAFIQVLFTDTKERAKAFGLFGITLGAAAIIGQVLGGYLSDVHGVVEGWRLIFFINLPIGVVTLFAARIYLTETSKHTGNKFDYSGIVILTLALFCLIYPLIEGRETGWPLWSIGLIVLSFGIFIYFIKEGRMRPFPSPHALMSNTMSPALVPGFHSSACRKKVSPMISAPVCSTRFPNRMMSLEAAIDAAINKTPGRIKYKPQSTVETPRPFCRYTALRSR